MKDESYILWLKLALSLPLSSLGKTRFKVLKLLFLKAQLSETTGRSGAWPVAATHYECFIQPEKSHYCMPAGNQNKPLLSKWAKSGFGDLFAKWK